MQYIKHLKISPITTSKWVSSKMTDGINVDDTQSMFALKILEKIDETRLKFSQESATAL